MLASTRSPNSVRTISGKGAVFIEARVTEVTHHKGLIYVRSFTQLTFYTTESLGGLRNKRSTYTYSQRVLESDTPRCAGGKRERSVQGCIHSVFWKATPQDARATNSQVIIMEAETWGACRRNCTPASIWRWH